MKTMVLMAGLTCLWIVGEASTWRTIAVFGSAAAFCLVLWKVLDKVEEEGQ